LLLHIRLAREFLAQSRLNQRYRALLRRGKLKNIAITAVAREFVGRRAAHR
jgi:hypothetical protein